MIKSNLRHIFSLTDKIITLTAAAQGLFAFLFFMIFAVASFRSDTEQRYKAIDSSFKLFERRFTEAAFIAEATGLTKLDDLSVLLDFKNYIRSSGIAAKVEINDCKKQSDASRFQLSVGKRILKNCVFVTSIQISIWNYAIWSLGAGLCAWILLGLSWMICRKFFQRVVIVPLVEELEDRARSLEFSKLAVQVAHDIRSPLGALRLAQEHIEGDPSITGLISKSIDRIETIALDLLSANRKEQSDLKSLQNILRAIRDIIEEKRMMYKKVQIEFDDSTAIFSAPNVVESEFKRHLSNLIQNAIEASPPEGLVEVRYSSTESDWKISIIDSGPGVSEQVIMNFKHKQISTGKNNGNGLGLNSANIFAVTHGGSLTICRLNSKTQVSLTFPKNKP